MSKLNKQMELAEAQITGFYECYRGGTMRDLASSMGLTREEWETMKKHSTVQSYLPQELGNEIEDYLSDKKE